jgi:hypothetical protein
MFRIKIKFSPPIKCGEDMVGKRFTNGDSSWKYIGINGKYLQYILDEDSDNDIVESLIREEYEAYRSGHYKLTSKPLENENQD